jgi:hypothetical protein
MKIISIIISINLFSKLKKDNPIDTPTPLPHAAKKIFSKLKKKNNQYTTTSPPCRNLKKTIDSNTPPPLPQAAQTATSCSSVSGTFTTTRWVSS